MNPLPPELALQPQFGPQQVGAAAPLEGRRADPVVDQRLGHVDRPGAVLQHPREQRVVLHQRQVAVAARGQHRLPPVDHGRVVERVVHPRVALDLRRVGGRDPLADDVRRCPRRTRAAPPRRCRPRRSAGSPPRTGAAWPRRRRPSGRPRRTGWPPSRHPAQAPGPGCCSSGTSVTGTGLVLRRSARQASSSSRTGPSRTITTWSGRSVCSSTALRNACSRCSGWSPSHTESRSVKGSCICRMCLPGLSERALYIWRSCGYGEGFERASRPGPTVLYGSYRRSCSDTADSPVSLFSGLPWPCSRLHPRRIRYPDGIERQGFPAHRRAEDRHHLPPAGDVGQPRRTGRPGPRAARPPRAGSLPGQPGPARHREAAQRPGRLMDRGVGHPGHPGPAGAAPGRHLARAVLRRRRGPGGPGGPLAAARRGARRADRAGHGLAAARRMAGDHQAPQRARLDRLAGRRDRPGIHRPGPAPVLVLAGARHARPARPSGASTCRRSGCTS